MKTTTIRVDLDKLMAKKIEEIEKERKLYPHETITPLDVTQEGFCFVCGFKLAKNEEGNCGVCESKYWGK